MWKFQSDDFKNLRSIFAGSDLGPSNYIPTWFLFWFGLIFFFFVQHAEIT